MAPDRETPTIKVDAFGRSYLLTAEQADQVTAVFRGALRYDRDWKTNPPTPVLKPELDHTFTVEFIPSEVVEAILAAQRLGA